MLRAATVSALAVLVSACGPGTPVVSPAWPEASFDLAFVFDVTDEASTVLAGPFRLEDGVPVGLDPVRRELLPEHALAFVGFTAENLQTLHPRVDLDATSRFVLEPGAEACEGGREVGSDEWRAALAEESFQVESLDGLDSNGRALLTAHLLSHSLRLPLKACEAPLSFVSHGRPGPLFDEGAVINGAARFSNDGRDAFDYFTLRGVRRVDETSALIRTLGAIARLPVNQPYDDRNAEWALIREHLPPGSGPGQWVLRRLSPDPTRPGLFFASAYWSAGNSDVATTGALLEIDTTQSPFGVETSTIVTGPVGDVARGLRGELLLVGGHHLVLLQQGPGAPWQSIPARPSDDFVKAVAVPFAGKPFFVAGAGAALYFVEESGGRWSVEHYPVEVGVNAIFGVALRDAEGVPELWVSLYAGLVTYREDREWKLSKIDVPGAFSACFGEADSCGWRHPTVPLQSFTALPGGGIVFAPRTCRSHYYLQPEDRCVAPIAVDGAVVEGPLDGQWEEADADERGVLVVGSGSRLLVSQPR